MKAVFVHDHRFTRRADGVYSSGQYPAKIWRRYLEFFSHLTVIGREVEVRNVEEPGGLAYSSHPRVRFVLLPSLSTPRAWLGARQRAAARIHEALASADALIARVPSQLGFLAADLARRLDKPWALEIVGCVWDALWNHGSILGKVSAPYQYHVMRRLVALSEFNLYVSRNFLQERYPSKGGRSIACSDVDIPEPDRRVLLARLDNIHKRSQLDHIVFGLIGSLSTRYKGIQVVLGALPRVRRSVPKLQFRVLGSGPADSWRLEANERGVLDLVNFDGILPPGDAVLGWLDDVDIYLQPSLQEGLPRALVEAMSRGCPAIGSRRAGIVELLDESCLVKPGDQEELGQKMVEAASDLSWQLKQARRNWEEASQYYSADLLAVKRASFWEEFAKAARFHRVST